MTKVKVQIVVELKPDDQGAVLAIIPVQQLATKLVPEVEKLIGPQTDLDAGTGLDTQGQAFLIEFRPRRGAQPKL